MSEGFEIYNPDGSIAISSRTPMTFLLGSFNTGRGTDGAFTIPDIGLTQYFAYITGVVTPPSALDAFGSEVPEITTEGRVITWKFGYGGRRTPGEYTITYGGYSI